MSRSIVHVLALLSVVPLGIIGVGHLPSTSPASTLVASRDRPPGNTSPAKRSGAATPTLALPAEQAYGKLKDPSLCAAECFEGVASYSTPAYVSLDQERSVTLVYRSGQAAPRGIVMVDATDPGPTPAARMSIRIDQGGGTYIASTSGATEIFYTTGLGANRLAFIFSASSIDTRSLNYTAVVTAYDAAGVPSAPATIPVRVLVINERSSPFGAGWTIAGHGRVYERSSGSLVITNGDGSASYFEPISCPSTCTYNGPSGDFSTLTRRASWDSGIKWDRGYPDGTRIEYRSDGQIYSIMRPIGGSMFYDYNVAGQLVTIFDPNNQTTTFSYDGNGKLSSITTHGGRVSQFTVNAGGDLAQIRDPDGVVAASFTYDGSHRLLTRTDRRGGVWGFGYDFAGKLARDTIPQITADGVLTRPLTRFVSIETASLVNPNSGFGTSSNPAPRVRPDTLRAIVTNPRGYAMRMTLDRFGAPTRIEEPLGGRRTKITRDSHGRPTRTVGPADHTVWYTWSATLPNLNQVHDSVTGRIVNYEYDSTRYNLLTRVHGDVSEVRHFLNSVGSLVDSTKVGTDPATIFTYDGFGRVLTERDPSGHVVQHTYSSTGPRNRITTTVAGRTARFGYDGFGRLLVDTTPDNKVTRRLYDLLNRDTLTVRPLNDTTKLKYDALFLTSVRDAKGQRYAFARNALGWVERDTFPVPTGVNAVRSYNYDRNGNLTSSVNRRGQTVTFAYDELDNLTSRVADGQTTTFATDPRDFFVAASNGESTDTVKLDTPGRPYREVSVRGATRYELRSTFDVRDLRTMVRVVSPWVDTLRFVYDAKMQLDTVVDWGNGHTALGQDEELLPNQMVLPTSPALTITREHPATHTPSAILYSNVDVNYEIGHRYTYNQRGQLWRRILAGQSDELSQTGREFGYDDLSRLTRSADYVETQTTSTCGTALVDENGNPCTSPGSTQFLNEQNFTYDKVGNRTDAAALTANGNRLARFAGDSMTYDADGNLTRRWRLAGGFDQTYAWNSLGQLTSVTTNGATVSFGYDGFGRRVRKSTASGTVVYVWDGDDLVAELDGSGNRVAEYTYYPGVDNPHSVRRGGASGSTYYFATDHPGNVVGMINSAGQLVNKYGYQAFGAMEDSSITVPNQLRFAARELDRETGLYYIRARYYDPTSGRFVSEDPIGLEGGINAYVYAGNDPMNGRDPSGLESCQWSIMPYGTESDRTTVRYEIVIYCPLGHGSGASANFGNPNARGGTSARGGTAGDAAVSHAGGAGVNHAAVIGPVIRAFAKRYGPTLIVNTRRASERVAARLAGSKPGSYVYGFSKGLAVGQVPGGRHLPVPTMNRWEATGVRHGKYTAQGLEILAELMKATGLP